MSTAYPIRAFWAFWALLALPIVVRGPNQATRNQSAQTEGPKVAITEIPSEDCGGPAKTEPIGGKVTGVGPNQCRIVIYSQACNGVLYVQPTIAAPFTKIRSDGAFHSEIHLGQTYFVLVVRPAFRPKSEISEVPDKGGDIVAVVEAVGKKK